MVSGDMTVNSHHLAKEWFCVAGAASSRFSGCLSLKAGEHEIVQARCATSSLPIEFFAWGETKS